MTTDKSAKILLLGKTGTGKSSFINYFIGKDVAKTGVGITFFDIKTLNPYSAYCSADCSAYSKAILRGSYPTIISLSNPKLS